MLWIQSLMITRVERKSKYYFRIEKQIKVEVTVKRM